MAVQFNPMPSGKTEVFVWPNNRELTISAFANWCADNLVSGSRAAAYGGFCNPDTGAPQSHYRIVVGDDADILLLRLTF